LDPIFFDNLEGPLAHKHVFSPITFGGIRLMLIVITLTIYLRNWALVASVIVVRFMVN
jgi:hypothetical protein